MINTGMTSITAILLALPIAHAHAQVDGIPYVDATGAYAQSQVMRHDGGETGKAGKTKVDGVDQLHQDGVIDEDDRNTLRRHLDEHRRDLKDELKRIVPEYERRVARDGRASADAWLAATAHALGVRDGARSRRVVDSLSAERTPASSD